MLKLNSEYGQIYQGNALDILRQLPDESVQMCVTSPPYWGLRDYGVEPMIWDDPGDCEHVWGNEKTANQSGGTNNAFADKKNWDNGPVSQGQFCQLCGAWRGSLGLEPTPELFIKHMVQIFSEVKRVLRDDGTLWLNMGDSYWAGKGQSGQGSPEYQENRKDVSINKPYHQIAGPKQTRPQDGKHETIKPKDLCGIPWMLAFALRADGWYLRSDIIWHKPNPMPESVTDRPTKAHEYMFLLSKSQKYFYDSDAIKEGFVDDRMGNPGGGGQYAVDAFKLLGTQKGLAKGKWNENGTALGRNKRTVWTIPTSPMPDAHFATFPKKLIEPCILAGSAEGGTVLDPFFGSGTTGLVAYRHGRKFVGIELSKIYLDDIAIPRINKETQQMKLF